MTECFVCPPEVIRCAHLGEETVSLEMQNEQWILTHIPDGIFEEVVVIGDRNLSHAEEFWNLEVEKMRRRYSNGF